jgi:hypothetical protein
MKDLKDIRKCVLFKVGNGIFIGFWDVEMICFRVGL